MLRLTNGSAASTYIMRRFKIQDVKNEPFLGFRSGFFNKPDDLVCVGEGVGSHKGQYAFQTRPTGLIGKQVHRDHQGYLCQALFVYQKLSSDNRNFGFQHSDGSALY